MTTPLVVVRMRQYVLLLGLALVLGATISGAGPALSALPAGDAVAVASTWGTTLTIKRPASTAAGDVLVASVNARLSSSSSISAPAGWSLIRQDSSSPGYRSLTQALYYKVAGASEPAGYDWSLSSASSATGAVLDFKNVDRTTPIDAHSGAFMPDTRFATAPSITTTVPGDVVVGFFAMSASKRIRPPSGMTEAYQTIWASQARAASCMAKGSPYSKPEPASRKATRDSPPKFWSQYPVAACQKKCRSYRNPARFSRLGTALPWGSIQKPCQPSPSGEG